MQIYDVSVRFSRKIQVVNFEPAEAEVSLKAQLTEGEDYKAAITGLMADARAGVTAGLKSKAAGVTAENVTTIAGPVPAAEAPAQKTTTPVKPTQTATEPAPAAEAPKRQRGRPAGSTAKKTDAAAPAAGADFDPDATPVAPAKTTAPAATDDDFGDEALPAEAEPADDEFAENEVKPMSTKELQEQLSAFVNGKQIDGPSVKAVLKKYGADRSADTKEGDRAKILAEVTALVAAKAKK